MPRFVRHPRRMKMIYPGSSISTSIGIGLSIPGAYVAPSSCISPKRLPFSLVNSL